MFALLFWLIILVCLLTCCLLCLHLVCCGLAGVGLVALVFGLFVKILLLPGCCVLVVGYGYVLRCWRLKFAVGRIRLLF